MPVSTFLIGSVDPTLYSMTDRVKRANPTNIDLGDAMKWTDYDPIWANRGRAIQEYAGLESGLCSIFVALIGLSWETASTIFYKITSAPSRLAILEKLLHQAHGAKFNLFWNSFSLSMRPIDNKRNEIVHWMAAASVQQNDDGVLLVGVTLVSPAAIHRKQATEHITSRDLLAFAEKCDDYTRLATSFALVLRPPASYPQAEVDALSGIFQQPLVYPLPAGHRLARTVPAPDIHPRSLPQSLHFLRPSPNGLGCENWEP